MSSTYWDSAELGVDRFTDSGIFLIFLDLFCLFEPPGPAVSDHGQWNPRPDNPQFLGSAGSRIILFHFNDLLAK